MIPMIHPPEVRTNLRNAWHVLRLQPNAMSRFTLDRRSVMMSFWIIALIAPIQLASQAQEMSQLMPDGAAAQVFNAHFVGLLCFVCSWLLFPVIIANGLQRLDKLDRLGPYLVVHNWTNGLIMALSFLISLVALTVLPPAMGQTLLFAVMVFGIVIRWKIKREMLQISSGRATWYTIIDMLLLGVLFMPYLDALGLTDAIMEAQREALQGQL